MAYIDPSDSYKYLNFLVKLSKQQVKNEGSTAIEMFANLFFEDEFITTLNKFHNHMVAKRIKKNDISSYETFDDVVEEVQKADEIVKQKESEKEVIKLFDSPEFLVLTPLTYEASKTYGSETKWCVTQKTTWDSYLWNYRLVFIIDRKNNKKYAVSRKFSTNEISGWDSEDKSMSPLMLPIPEDVFMVIMKEIKKPIYEPEIGNLNETHILGNDGRRILIEEATKDEYKTFIDKFFKHLPQSFKDKLNQVKKNGVTVNDISKVENKLYIGDSSLESKNKETTVLDKINKSGLTHDNIFDKLLKKMI